MTSQEATETCSATEHLVAALTCVSPKDRKRAAEAMCMPFFTDIKGLSNKEWSTCVLCDLNGDNARQESDAGISCSEGHFHCAKCGCTIVENFFKVENGGVRASREGQIFCCKYPFECTATSFHTRDLAKHLCSDLFHQYLETRLEDLQQQKEAQLEAEMKKRIDAEIERLRTLDEHERKVLESRKHIEDSILQPKCPRCKRAFHDFEGCFAISCSSCPCKFCGWCLQDCGDRDAHQHVRSCKKVPRGVDALFPQMPTVRAAFEKVHKGRCQEMYSSYLKSLEEKIRGDVERAVRGLLPW